MARAPRPIRTAAAYAQLTKRQQATYDKVLAAARDMRRGSAARVAAKRAGTTPQTMKRYLGADMQRGQGGRLKFRRDRAYRRMDVLTNSGPTPVQLNRRDASTVAKHWNAVKRYLEFDDTSDLSQFRGVVVAGAYELETDLDVIDAIAGLDLLSIEDIYKLAA